MAKAYSEDLRRRVVATVEGGRSCRETAALYQVSPAFVIRLLARWRTSGSVAASSVRGHKPRVLAGREDWLREWVAAEPDITLAELQEKLKGRGIRLTMVGIWKYLCRMGLSYKKSSTRRRAGQAGRGGRTGRVEG